MTLTLEQVVKFTNEPMLPIKAVGIVGDVAVLEVEFSDASKFYVSLDGTGFERLVRHADSLEVLHETYVEFSLVDFTQVDVRVVVPADVMALIAYELYGLSDEEYALETVTLDSRRKYRFVRDDVAQLSESDIAINDVKYWVLPELAINGWVDRVIRIVV